MRQQLQRRAVTILDAPRAARNLPVARPRKLTSRSASPSGKVFKIMASVSRAGMNFFGAPPSSPALL
jgi:hypothetical protein